MIDYRYIGPSVLAVLVISAESSGFSSIGDFAAVALAVAVLFLAATAERGSLD